MAILSDSQVSCQVILEAQYKARYMMFCVPQILQKYHCFAHDSFQRGAHLLSDAEVMNLVTLRKIMNYKLEGVLETPERGVAIRRELLSSKLPVPTALASLPYKDYNYSQVLTVLLKCSPVYSWEKCLSSVVSFKSYIYIYI